MATCWLIAASLSRRGRSGSWVLLHAQLPERRYPVKPLSRRFATGMLDGSVAFTSSRTGPAHTCHTSRGIARGVYRSMYASISPGRTGTVGAGAFAGIVPTGPGAPGTSVGR